MVIKKGDHATVDYEGRLDDGSVFDGSHMHEGHAHYLEVDVGEGMVLEQFDDALIGMEKGEEKEIIIQPEKGYGEHNASLVHEIPREAFPPEEPIKPGMVIQLQSPQGQKYHARIIGVADETVTIDLNHPLAGKTLHFTIKIVDIKSKIDL